MKLRCPKCRLLYDALPRDLEHVRQGRGAPLCPGCFVGRALRRLLVLFFVTVLLAGLLLSLTGCCRPGAYGPGPASDGEQQELERIRRERGAAKVSQREAAQKLRHLNPMGGG